MAVVVALAVDNSATAGRFKRVCAECGQSFRAHRDHAEFCTVECRKAFNNRRALRGAELYDLFMCLRYERGIARALKVWNLLCRMAQGFREDDQREREGRNSWRPARQVLDRHTYLHSTVVSRQTWRNAI